MNFCGAVWDRAVAELAIGAPVTYEELGARFYLALSDKEKQKHGTQLPGLTKAVERMKVIGDKDYDFFGSALPAIFSSAKDLPSLLPPAWEGALPRLSQGNNTAMQISRRLAHSLLCWGFLGILPPIPEQLGYGELDFVRLTFTEHHVAVERILCQLIYFHQVQQKFANGTAFPSDCSELVFRRVAVTPNAVPDWGTCPELVVPAWDLESKTVASESTPPIACRPTATILDETGIEDTGSYAQVDFANKQIHIGCLIPSMTQEEVLFSVRPELFLTLPLCNTLMANEAVVAFGAKKFCTYTGYGDTFQVKESFGDEFHDLTAEEVAAVQRAHNNPQQAIPVLPAPAVVVIDAIVNRGDQYELPLLRRDLLKAYAGYASLPLRDVAIATGKWGCGVFRGDPILKYLQQLMAIAVFPTPFDADRVSVLAATTSSPDDTPLRHIKFCTWHTPKLASDLQKLTVVLMKCKVTVGQLYHWLLEFAECYDDEDDKEKQQLTSCGLGHWIVYHKCGVGKKN